MRAHAWRIPAAAGCVAVLTAVAQRVIPVNAPTVGFAYLLLVLVIASFWGFAEACTASILATLEFNYYFFPPVGTFTIADPQNWVALLGFLATSLIASRLSAAAKRRAADAIERQQALERLYSYSRAILLFDDTEPFGKQLAHKVADIFCLRAVALYERASGEIYHAGPGEFEGMDEQLREAALKGTSFSSPEANRVITAVRLGSEPIASLGLEGAQMPDSVVQGIGNLVAIGLERSKARDLAHQVELARQSEQLRTAIIDAMAHEFKTPLTAIRAATTSLLANPAPPDENQTELLRIAGEAAEHLNELIENAIEMARLDTDHIEAHLQLARLDEVIQDVVKPAQTLNPDRRFEAILEGDPRPAVLDVRLIRLAMKQLLDNALKYSPPGTPITIRLRHLGQNIAVDITNSGKEIPPLEQRRIFERFYRSPSVQSRIPGSGLGLSIAHRIAQAHGGDLAVTSRGGNTTFSLSLPAEPAGAIP